MHVMVSINRDRKIDQAALEWEGSRRRHGTWRARCCFCQEAIGRAESYEQARRKIVYLAWRRENLAADRSRATPSQQWEATEPAAQPWHFRCFHPGRHSPC